MSFFLTNVILSFFLSFFPSKHRRVVQVLSAFQRFFKTRSYRVFTVFYRIELGFTGFLPMFIRLDQIGPGFYWVFPFFGFYRVLPGFTELNWFLPFLNYVHQVLSGSTRFYRVLPGFTVFPGFTEFYWVVAVLNQVWLGFTGLNCVLPVF